MVREIFGQNMRGILEEIMDSLLYYCFPSFFMAPRSPFTGGKYHQPFRQLIDRAIEYIRPKRTKETELCGICVGRVRAGPVGVS